LLQTFRYSNQLLLLITGITVLLGMVILFVPIIRDFFELAPVQFLPLFYCLITALLSVVWIEALKWVKRRQVPKDQVNHINTDNG
jgi:Ca2+-transporting ATPase